MLAVVDDVTVHLERRRATPEQTAAFEQFHARTGALEASRRSKTRKAAADDRYTCGRSHEPTTTRNFSPFESAARPCSGNCGSRSILRKMPS